MFQSKLVSFQHINFDTKLKDDQSDSQPILLPKVVSVCRKNNSFSLARQDMVLTILCKLQDFDEKHGTQLFQNIIYNDLYDIIYNHIDLNV
jgi:hypothetical protein